MTVHFIGAGSGAVDLITLRGRDLIASCPVCMYAGSLIPEAMLNWCPDGAKIINTAPMDLDAIEAEFIDAPKFINHHNIYNNQTNITNNTHNTNLQTQKITKHHHHYPTTISTQFENTTPNKNPQHSNQ